MTTTSKRWVTVLAALLAGQAAWAQLDVGTTESTTEAAAVVVEATEVAADATETVNETTEAAEAVKTPEPAAEAETAPAPEAVKANPMIVIETSLGTIKAELWPDKAPQTVANMQKYIDAQYYDGTVFHRVIKNFMIQGGGFTPDMQQKPSNSPVANEARADVPNARGTLAMARTMVVDSATSQFFINLVDNAFLNHRDKSPQGYGYCVFGQVTEGMDVVDKIAAVKTGSHGPFQDVPAEAVVIKSIRTAP